MMEAANTSISKEFVLDGAVSYWNVDRDNVLSLRSLAAFLQEAAIRHADQCGAGAHAKETRGESWVLHRMAVSVTRYPSYEEVLRVVTWSSGVRAFKGYRDFRIYCGSELIVAASSIWLYVNIGEKAICRVPKDVAEGFPTRHGDAFFPDMEKARLEPPPVGSFERDVSVRYSDFDGNMHVNNTVFFDYLQSALVSGGYPPRPATLQIQFLKEIAPTVEHVKVTLDKRGPAIAFGLGNPTGLFAHGLVT